MSLISTIFRSVLWKKKVMSHLPKSVTLKLNESSVAIDCGANMGVVTLELARTGARVFAFEPNPHAYRCLAERVGGMTNVTTYPVAVGVDAGTHRLYYHERAKEDPIKWASGSSLLPAKPNVDRESYIDVEVVDLCAFIDSLSQRVGVLKIDIEGAECAVLRKLIESDLISKVDHLFCEMHDHKIPELRQESDELRRLVRDRRLLNVHLNWI